VQEGREVEHGQAWEFVPAYVVAILLFLIAVILFLGGWAATVPMLQVAYVIGAAILFVAAALLGVWPTFSHANRAALYEFPAALGRVRDAVADITGIQREHRRFLLEVNEVHTRLQQQAHELAELQAALRDLHLDFAEVGKLRQNISQLKQELDKWRDNAISFFELLERQLDNPSLPQERREALEDIVRSYERVVARRGVTLVRPAPGDPFVPSENRALRKEHHSTIPENHVITCCEWGFREGSTVLRSAAVVLSAGPAPKPTEARTGTGDDLLENFATAPDHPTSDSPDDPTLEQDRRELPEDSAATQSVDAVATSSPLPVPQVLGRTLSSRVEQGQEPPQGEGRRPTEL